MNSINETVLQEALQNLAHPFRERDSESIEPNTPFQLLWTACQDIANVMGIKLTPPASVDNTLSLRDSLEKISQSSGFPLRQVTLTGQWWAHDQGPLLVFHKIHQTPHALLFDENGYITYSDPMHLQKVKVTEDFITDLETDAYSFYRTLPESALNWKSLLQFSFFNIKKETFSVISLHVLVGLCALVFPILTGNIIDNAIPNADKSLFVQFLLAYVLFISLSSILQFFQTFILIRIRYKLAINVQSSIWDRVLKLPTAFFRQFQTGDLANRIQELESIQDHLTHTLIENILQGVFSLLSLGLMFYYDIGLTLLCLLFGLSVMGAELIIAKLQIKYHTAILSLQGRTTAFITQCIHNISKLRVNHKESYIFRIWGEYFSKMNLLSYKVGKLNIFFSLFHQACLMLTTIFLFAIVANHPEQFPLKVYIIFSNAFWQFFSGIQSISTSIASLIEVIPSYVRVKPLLTSILENQHRPLSPPLLQGNIQIDNIQFAYQSDSPLVFNHFSLSIPKESFIALVGHTGCGKSTLFRLLLGFETPNQGKILYDGQDLAQLNLKMLRQQIGVVLQHGVLLPGTLLQNIIGIQKNISINEVWDTLSKIGLEKDVRALPLGLHTPLLEGGHSFSVGQRQRIMIARALLQKPRLLFLDEATASLDNPTQLEVMRTIEALSITRIVAAHRLSTLVHAHHIYFIEEGHIAETGTYTELLQQNGKFAKFVQLQRNRT